MKDVTRRDLKLLNELRAIKQKLRPNLVRHRVRIESASDAHRWYYIDITSGLGFFRKCKVRIFPQEGGGSKSKNRYDFLVCQKYLPFYESIKRHLQESILSVGAESGEEYQIAERMCPYTNYFPLFNDSYVCHHPTGHQIIF